MDIPAAPIYKNYKIVMSCIINFVGLIKALKCLKKPTLVVGFGSFHTFPVLLAAKILRIKTMLFEANCSPGKVNRFFAKKDVLLASQFPFSHKNHTLVQRFPWRPKTSICKQEAKKNIAFNPNNPVFLLFGGSQGAQFLNDLFYKVIPFLQREKIFFSIIHMTGSDIWTQRLEKIYRNLRVSAIVQTYSKDMEPYYLASDLIIARSGAGTIAEIFHYEKASLLIPYPYSSEDHQMVNANFMTKTVHCAKTLCQKDCTVDILFSTLKQMVDNNEMEKMEEALLKYKQGEREAVSLDTLIFSTQVKK